LHWVWVLVLQWLLQGNVWQQQQQQQQ
jgi:hypothetical protein